MNSSPYYDDHVGEDGFLDVDIGNDHIRSEDEEQWQDKRKWQYTAFQKVVSLAHQLVPMVTSRVEVLRRRVSEVGEDDQRKRSVGEGEGDAGSIVSSFVDYEWGAFHVGDDFSICTDVMLLEEEAEALMSTMDEYQSSILSENESNKNLLHEYDHEHDDDDDQSIRGEMIRLKNSITSLQQDMADIDEAHGGRDSTSSASEALFSKPINIPEHWLQSIYWSIAIFMALYILLGKRSETLQRILLRLQHSDEVKGSFEQDSQVLFENILEPM